MSETTLMILLIFLLYLLAVVILIVKALSKSIAWVPVMTVGLLLTPVGGYIYYSRYRRTRPVILDRYHCSRCNIDFTEKTKFCSYCERDGIRTPLKQHKIHSL